MRYFSLAILTTTVQLVFAQPTNFNTQRNWSMNKKEVTIGIGATQFLGDLGGANQIGTDYSLKDWDFPSMSYGGSIAYRYRWHPYYSTSTILNIGMFKGSDALTQEPVRNARNLNFRSPVINLSQRFELIALANEKIGRRFNIPNLRGFKDHNEQLYLFAGVGIAYYNPKGNQEGSWVELRPLRTEGQGLAGGPSEYRRITATIPLGVGMRMGINRFWRVGLEFTYVKTFSDYIDDVGGNYYDPAILASEVGPEAALYSNPAAPANQWMFNPGSMRGQKQKDALFYMNLTITRNFTYSKIGPKGGRIKYGRYRAKF
jgi:hypothetical protein